MSIRPHVPLLPRLLFCLTTALALALVGLVLVAPAFDEEGPTPAGWPRVFAVFARDVAVRRIAVAAAPGLLVTACVFFRAPVRGRRGPRPPRSPNHVVGA